MLHCSHFAQDNQLVTDTISLTYDNRLKSRQILTLATGEMMRCSLPTGTILRQGDKLLAENAGDNRVVMITAAAEPLVEVRVGDVLQFARAAYHMGNRHVKVEIGEDQHGHWLRFQPDHVLEAMLGGLGCILTNCTVPFQPEGGAYSGHAHAQTHHDHDHHHEHTVQSQGGPKIHSFGQ